MTLFFFVVIAYFLPQFEVASVKPSNSNERMNYGLRADGLFGTNMPAKGWIQIAYGVKEFQIVGPDWISNEKFDITAKAEKAASARQKLLMLQALLAERFQLKLHEETKEASVYALVIDRKGLKMKPSKDQTLFAGDYPDGSPDGRPLSGAGPGDLGPGKLVGESMPMTVLLNLLAGPLDRPVLNQTGLTGRYHVDLHYIPGSGQAPPADGDRELPKDDSAATLFTAMQEQLGLRLVATKGPVKMLIIDHIERPVAN